ncbi:MAG: 4-hydroxythreonine-4-phosphate dehydrogenase PdxA [Burkholderiales bacterium]|nr:4-hydroxythreonine-4-phosphate dehydrogenase PdxA [Burkholderiales bacterium]
MPPTSSTVPIIAITAGEPAGIGPELCAVLAGEKWPAHLVIVADRSLIESRGTMTGTPVCLPDFSSHSTSGASLLHVSVAAPAVPGKLNPANSFYVLETLQRVLDGCLTGVFDAAVTAPVHKGVINDAGISFTGHTEFFAEKSGTPRVVMMLVGGGLRVALATTHLPLAAVPAAVTRDGLTETLRILHRDMVRRFGIASPRIVVAGLNPHAGESGYLGREEIDVIGPVIESLKKEGMRLQGPLPADTLFTPEHLKHADCVLAMYHDQGLTTVKYASFGQGVNITLGLPIIRTSVDHGTALHLAGTGKADASSLRAALKLAIELVQRSKQQSAEAR